MFNESMQDQMKISFKLIWFSFRKKTFEKIVDAFKGIEQPTMRELGLEFLRVYDGRFNYREGHTVSNSFSSIKFKYVRLFSLLCHIERRFGF